MFRRTSMCGLPSAYALGGLLLVSAFSASPANGQRLSFGEIRPFVVGIVPVVGRNGAVGGVLVDAEGVVARAESAETARLREARERALAPASAELRQSSRLRKVSLRRLEEAIARRLAEKTPLSDEMNYLAGLQQVRFVFLFPDQRDIVLAGPAEGWRVTETGDLVGVTTGSPVLLLEDLLVALRSAESVAGSGILCSIDPRDEGLASLSRLLRGRAAPSAALVRRMEETLGPQVVTVEGVPADSRVARVLVSADVIMKRLAMGFEPAPVTGLPSYLALLSAGGAPPRTITPRWWLAPEYDRLLRDDAGEAWELRGRRIRAHADEGPEARDGSPGQQWADRFTEKYGELAAAFPVFAELQNCMDLTIVAALIAKEDLGAAAGCELPLLMDAERLPTGSYPTPRSVPSQASVVKVPRNWIVSISGGVEADPWRIAEQTDLAASLTAVREQAAPKDEVRWWWD